MRTENDNGTVRYIGRFKQLEDGRMCCSWSGSAVEAGFTGTGIAVLLVSTAQQDYVDVVIDGNRLPTLTIEERKQQYLLAEGLEDAYHWVRVTKRVEGSKSMLTFGGFVYRHAEPAPVPPARTRRLELIGDSITAGFGNEGPDAWSGYRLSEQNACNTYGALAAEKLDAEATIIAWSGMGLVQDLTGSRHPVMPELYGRTLATEPEQDWDFGRNIPDAVVINIGTNDFVAPTGMDEKEFKKEYLNFIKRIRGYYTDAYIFCVVGTIHYKAWDATLQAVESLNEAGDNRICCYRFRTASEFGEPNGTDGHPSLMTHRRMAQELTKLIRKTTGWQ